MYKSCGTYNQLFLFLLYIFKKETTENVSQNRFSESISIVHFLAFHKNFFKTLVLYNISPDAILLSFFLHLNTDKYFNIDCS